MKGQHTINLNGRTYDVATGLPLSKPAAQNSKKAATRKTINDITPHKTGAKNPSSHAVTPAKKLHGKAQRSRALARAPLKKPDQPQIKKPAHTSRSPKITKFAKESHASSYVKPQPAKSAAKNYASHPGKKPAMAANLSAKEIKEQLINKRLADLPAREPSKIVPPERKDVPQSRSRRIASVGATCVALLLLGGYLTYLNMPNLSIRVAALRAGIDASLPNYQPKNYDLHGPVAYSDGTVKLAYRSSQNASKKYTVTQQASTWNSQAVLDNYVADDSHNDYRITSIHGLTVYTYDNKAVWVNGGILYIIDGTAPLSAQQLDRIASSM